MSPSDNRSPNCKEIRTKINYTSVKTLVDTIFYYYVTPEVLTLFCVTLDVPNTKYKFILE